jgi:hypothetical protein
MPTLAGFEPEKRELETVLASGIFNRAPNLANLLTWVCAKYFEGAAGDIKEYNIAVEALGRSPEFDQKRDSIVRVEAHRLRKRLRAYYESEGAGHQVQIEIPPGQYTPRFVSTLQPVAEIPAAARIAEPANEIEPVVELEPVTLPGAIRPVPGEVRSGFPPRRRAPRWMVLILAIAVAAAVVFWMSRQRSADPRAGMADLQSRIASADDVRILAGATQGTYTDSLDHLWLSDRFFQDGAASDMPHAPVILGTHDPRLFHYHREGSFSYHIPLKPGAYEMRLYFAETVYGENNIAGGGETSRIFDVYANGRPLLPGFDIVRDAGSLTADVRVFKDISPDKDGKLHLDFRASTNSALLNAIEITPGVKGLMRPIRIAARDHALRDSAGHQWDPDRYARGGQLAPRTYANVTGGPDPELFRSERFGNLTYTIPVAQRGRYGVTLYFAENWFGPGMAGGGGEGSRLFDILCNGVILRRKFDIFHEAGGSGRATTVSFHGVEPNHRGKIVIALDPITNYALLNALEIVDESGDGN